MIDIQKHSRQIALALLGEQNKKKSTADELRWGTNGSLSVNIRKGTFTNFETDESGGMVDLIKLYHGDNVSEFLSNLGLVDTTQRPVKSNGSTGQNKGFTREEMRSLCKDAELITTFKKDYFYVARWPDKTIRPISVVDSLWYFKRPDGLMPLCVSDGDASLPALICEGEKTHNAIVKNSMYKGSVCTWHGGANSYDKADWSVITQAKAIIYPDNDDPGYKAALGIKSILESQHIEVTIAKNPNSWNDKDDLADHTDWDMDLLEYATENPYTPETPPVDPRRFRLVHATEAMTNLQPPDWVIKSVIESDSLSLLYGSAKAGKSFISISMAASISLGIPWYEHQTKPGFVVYLAGEGQRGIARRLLAWQEFHGYDLKQSKFHFSTRGAQLLNDEESLLLRDEVLTLQDHYKEPPKLVVIDTLARNFGAGNENSTEDMNRFVASIDRYIREEFGAAILLVHHTGHAAGARARGSSVLPAAVDWEYRVTREDDPDVTMYLDFEQTLIKDGKPLPAMRFEFQEVSLYEMKDEDGMVTTSGALREVPRVIKQKSKRLGKNQKLVKEAIETLHLKKQNDARNKGLETHNIYVSYDELTTYIKGQMSSDARLKAIEGLINNEQMGGNNEVGYIPLDAEQF